MRTVRCSLRGMTRRRRPARKSRTRTSRPRPTVKRRRIPVRQTTRTKATHQRVIKALADMRGGASLSAACRTERLKPQTFKRHAGRAIRRKSAGGRFYAMPTDSLRREMSVQTEKGPRPVVVKDFKLAQMISAHANAIAHFNRSGDLSKLRRFEGRTFRVGRQRIRFLTDPQKLRTLAEADALKLDRLYTEVD